MSGAGLRGRRLQIGVDEVRSLEQQLLAGRLRESVGEAVSEVELCLVAAAFAEIGDFEEAARWQERALEDPALSGDAEARARLDLYRKKQPYRQHEPGT